jgi:hypothetical protein
MHVHAGGLPQGAVVGQKGGVGTGVGVGVGVGEPDGSGVGVGVGVSVGVGVGVSVGVAVGSGVGVALGLGVAEGDGDGDPMNSFHTDNRGFISVFGGTSVTEGSSNVGMPSPPLSIATVPAGEMNMTFEFSAFAVRGVQPPLQK